MNVQLEQEIKFRLGDEAARRVWRMVELQGAPRERELASVYFDTRHAQLRRAGVSLRLRRDGRQWLQTLKADAPHAGLSARAEWEVPADGARLALAAFPVESIMAATGVDLKRLADRLKPLFETRFRRRSAVVRLAGGALAELSVDRGYVAAGGRREPLLELELELKAGGPRPMLRLAQKLAEPLGLALEFESKAARGYRLASDAPQPAPQKWRKLALGDAATPASAFPAVFGAALAQAGANARGVAQTHDIEFLHQLRVGLRRLRAALRAYRGMVSRGDAKPLARALRKLMPPLGAARDWDVFCEWLAGHEGSARPEVRALLAAARRRRGAARRAARATVSSAAYQGFLLRALRWLHEAPWLRASKSRDVPLPLFGAQALERLHHKVLQQGRDMRWQDVARRHELRIRIKRLRYACEFFAPCFARALVKPFLKRLEVLQDILGELNDVTVGRGLVAELAPRGSGGALAAGAGQVRRALGVRERALIRSLEPAWAALEKRRPFWRPR